MSILNDTRVRRIGALVAALVGAYLLYLAAHPERTARTVFLSLVADIASPTPPSCP